MNAPKAYTQHETVALASALLLVYYVTASPANGAELKDVQVAYEQGRYYVDAEMTVEAAQLPTFEALVEYDRFDEYSDVYVQTSYLDPAADGTPRVFTRVEGCVLSFCRGVERTARLVATPLDRIVMTIEPEPDGHLLYGQESWDLEPYSGGTLIKYHHELELNFWLPPLIGPWAVRRGLIWGATDVVQTLEEIALQGSYKPLAESPCCRRNDPHADPHSEP